MHVVKILLCSKETIHNDRGRLSLIEIYKACYITLTWHNWPHVDNRLWKERDTIEYFSRFFSAIYYIINLVLNNNASTFSFPYSESACCELWLQLEPRFHNSAEWQKMQKPKDLVQVITIGKVSHYRSFRSFAPFSYCAISKVICG